MAIDEHSRRLGRHMYLVSVGMIERLDTDPEIQDLAHAARCRPTPASIRALLDAGRDKPWLPSVIDALAEVGVAAADDVLGDGDDDR